MSAVNIKKLLVEVNQQQVQRLLGWDDLMYGIFQNEKGLEYLRRVVGSDEKGIKMLMRSELFWRWWVNHWNRRDEEFLGYAKATPQHMREAYYHDLHDADGFEFYPHRIIMEQSYAEMVGNLIDQTCRPNE